MSITILIDYGQRILLYKEWHKVSLYRIFIKHSWNLKQKFCDLKEVNFIHLKNSLTWLPQPTIHLGDFLSSLKTQLICYHLRKPPKLGKVLLLSSLNILSYIYTTCAHVPHGIYHVLLSLSVCSSSP